MNVFNAVKAHASTIDVAEHYGIEVNRHGKALCPFHNDRHPSLFVADDHYHCYACGEHGDSITLVAKLYGLPMYEAALKLAADFGIATDKPIPKDIQYKQRQKNEAQKFKENERLCFSLLCEYYKLMQHWMSAYAPKSQEDVVDNRFVEACHWLAPADYYLDLLVAGDSYERAEVVQMMLRDNGLQRLKSHLAKVRKEETHHVKQEI